MRYYLDSNIIIYLIEGDPALQQRARNHVAALEAADHHFAISELTWSECFVFPYRTSNGALLLDYQRFFSGPRVTMLVPNGAIYHRAAMIRGVHGFGLPDSIHLAIAVEHRLDRFLTNDQRLAGFPDIQVEMLP